MLALTLLVTSALAGTPGTVLKDKVDLDGDGKADKLLGVTAAGQGDQLALKVTVGKLSLADTQTYKDVAVEIVDIDPTDKSKELLITGTSDSGKKWFTVFIYDGKHLVQGAKINSGAGSGAIHLVGGGQIIIDMPKKFYTAHSAWHLEGLSLQEITQPFVYVGAKAHVTQDVLLVHDPSSSVTVTALAAGELVQVLIGTTDEKKWFLVLSPNGLVGWVDQIEIGRTIVIGEASADE